MNGANGTKTIQTLDDIADIVCDKPNIDASILVGAKKDKKIVRFILVTMKLK